MLEFIETPTFTRQVHTYLNDGEYTALQNELSEDPCRGDLIRGGGGIRKIRYGRRGLGTQGGLRVIYYWLHDDGRIYMLLIYPKSKKDNLTQQEIAVLKNLVKDF